MATDNLLWLSMKLQLHLNFTDYIHNTTRRQMHVVTVQRVHLSV